MAGRLRAVEGFVSFQEKVFQNLRQTILSDTLHPGDSLSEQEVARELGVSRTPVREALHKLEKEGLIVRDSWRQTIVAIPTPEDAEEVLYIRLALEMLAIDLGADSITADTIRAMRGLFQAFEGLTEITERSYKQYLEADKEFHRMIVELCGRKRLMREYQQWQDLSHWYRLLRLSEREHVGPSVIEHYRIIDRLEAKDPEGAKKCLRDHLYHAIEKYRVGLVERQEQDQSRHRAGKRKSDAPGRADAALTRPGS